MVRSDASGVQQMELSCVEWVFKSRQQKSPDSANPKAMELSHTAVRAKIQKAPSATNMPACLKLSTSALPMMQSAITARKKVTTSVCAMLLKLCVVLKKNQKLVFMLCDIWCWSIDCWNRHNGPEHPFKTWHWSSKAVLLFSSPAVFSPAADRRRFGPGLIHMFMLEFPKKKKNVSRADRGETLFSRKAEHILLRLFWPERTYLCSAVTTDATTTRHHFPREGVGGVAILGMWEKSKKSHSVSNQRLHKGAAWLIS